MFRRRIFTAVSKLYHSYLGSTGVLFPVIVGECSRGIGIDAVPAFRHSAHESSVNLPEPGAATAAVAADCVQRLSLTALRVPARNLPIHNGYTKHELCLQLPNATLCGRTD